MRPLSKEDATFLQKGRHEFKNYSRESGKRAFSFQPKGGICMKKGNPNHKIRVDAPRFLFVLKCEISTRSGFLLSYELSEGGIRIVLSAGSGRSSTKRQFPTPGEPDISVSREPGSGIARSGETKIPFCQNVSRRNESENGIRKNEAGKIKFERLSESPQPNFINFVA